ncbi:MAG: Grx4 family monothiol glutaredoxin [Pseudomonadota bacterium]
MKTTDKIRKQIAENPVLIYMKGTPELPMCGFSANAAAALKSTGLPFAHVDVLKNMQIMQALPEVSDWPTFPQIFIGGDLIGGGDIVIELNKTGELKALMQAAIGKSVEA